MTFSIVTDSASDLPTKLIKESNILVVPTTVIVEGKEFLDHEIKIDELLKKLKSGSFSSTSQPSPELFEQKYGQALKNSETKEVLAIHISSKLSGLFSTGYAVANNMNGLIRLFDTENVSIGSGYYVLLAIHLRELGFSLTQTIFVLENTRKQVNIEVLIDNIDYLKKGGRVNLSQFTLLKLLKLKPIITNKKGLLVREAVTVGKSRGLKKLCDRIKNYKNAGNKPMIIYGYADTPNDLKIMKSYFSDFETSQTLEIQIGSTLLSHAGPGVVGIMVAPEIQEVPEMNSSKQYPLEL